VTFRFRDPDGSVSPRQTRSDSSEKCPCGNPKFALSPQNSCRLYSRKDFEGLDISLPNYSARSGDQSNMTKSAWRPLTTFRRKDDVRFLRERYTVRSWFILGATTESMILKCVSAENKYNPRVYQTFLSRTEYSLHRHSWDGARGAPFGPMRFTYGHYTAILFTALSPHFVSP
jgi:hypothetical protein